MAAGDRLRVIYDGLSKDPNSLSNLDQDLPNYAQVGRVSGREVHTVGPCARCWDRPVHVVWILWQLFV